MEYEILGIDEGSSIEEAKKALKKIRLENHPDKVSEFEKERATTILRQAESAYKRIKDKTKMNNIFKNFFSSRMGRINTINDAFLGTGPHMGPQFGSFSMSNIYSNDIHDDRSVQTSSYSYQNHNGKITENGTINGRQMSEDELNKHRIGHNLRINKHIQ
jgi:DnaJ-class molecular chaperone